MARKQQLVRCSKKIDLFKIFYCDYDEYTRFLNIHGILFVLSKKKGQKFFTQKSFF